MNHIAPAKMCDLIELMLSAFMSFDVEHKKMPMIRWNTDKFIHFLRGRIVCILSNSLLIRLSCITPHDFIFRCFSVSCTDHDSIRRTFHYKHVVVRFLEFVKSCNSFSLIFSVIQPDQNYRTLRSVFDWFSDTSSRGTGAWHRCKGRSKHYC